MCGFTGFLTRNQNLLGCLDSVVKGMTLAIAHRGPDGTGTWSNRQEGIALGHRRLSILDLSSAGHQPMHSTCGRFVMAFNGEIYNHLQIRNDLEKEDSINKEWRGHSDTETLLAGIKAWGLEETLNRSVGMFAIALWDKKDRRLSLARDRFGEKPLYYGWVDKSSSKTLVFGSELKALRAYPGFSNSVCRQALSLYMRFSYVPSPYSIYQNIYKLEPGCLLTIDDELPQAPNSPLRPPLVYCGLKISRWWSLDRLVNSNTNKIITDQEEAIQVLQNCLLEAVHSQSYADVPVGAFLSGGVDSSTIVALMQKQANRPVKTFTVGFEDSDFDESIHAKAVAKHLGTEHTEIILTAREVKDVINLLPSIYDEPFADSSQIPTYLVCKAASKQVKVVLSGDAGDELFGGYNRYFWGPRTWDLLSLLPYTVRQNLGNAVTSVPVGAWDSLFSLVGKVRSGEKLHKLFRSLNGAKNMDSFYLNLVSEWQNISSLVKSEESQEISSVIPKNVPLNLNVVESMMFKDTISYLPDDILCKVDRAAMACGLETRVPFLDHRVAELAWQLPLDMKIRNDGGKWLLRQLLYKYVPSELIDRPKLGFSMPIGKWIRGPLRDWAEELLLESRLQSEGYFHPAPIRQKWIEHLSGRRDHTASLWTVLMFQAWLEEVT